MRWHLPVVTALAALFPAGDACPLGNQADVLDVLPLAVNQTLWRRVRVGGGGVGGEAPTASSLFSLGDASTPGGCSGQSGTLDNWIKESVLLHDAVETAYEDTKSNKLLRILWIVFFGIKFTSDGSPDPDDELSLVLWRSIGERISSVSQFLSGAGLPGSRVDGKPWVFCSEDAGERVQFDQPMKDKNGERAVIDWIEHPDGTIEPTEFLKLGQVFPAQASNDNIRAFFMAAFNGYEFDENGYDTLCGRPTLYATTPKVLPQPRQELVDVLEIELGEYNRHIIFCPPAFSSNLASHTYPSLTQAVSQDHYPTGNEEDDNTDKNLSLDRYLTVSATMYHELYHLADAGLITSDPYYSLQDVLQAGSIQAGDTHRNPESFTFFAMAAYMYLNPPEGKDAVVFVGGRPRKAKYFNIH